MLGHVPDGTLLQLIQPVPITPHRARCVCKGRA